MSCKAHQDLSLAFLVSSHFTPAGPDFLFLKVKAQTHSRPWYLLFPIHRYSSTISFNSLHLLLIQLAAHMLPSQRGLSGPHCLNTFIKCHPVLFCCLVLPENSVLFLKFCPAITSPKPKREGASFFMFAMYFQF